MFIIKPQSSNQRVFSQDLLLKKLLTFITVAQLPFHILKHPKFKDLVDFIQLTQSKINLPSTRTTQHYLDTTIQEQQRKILETLPDESQLSIILNY